MMDIIVREIKYELLNDIARFFSIDNQFTFVSYLDKEQIDKEYNIKPYILKEYIADIDAVLDECETYANDYYMSPIHKVIKWDDFYFSFMLDSSSIFDNPLIKPDLFWRVTDEIGERYILLFFSISVIIKDFGKS
jgi:hypothetical protein